MNLITGFFTEAKLAEIGVACLRILVWLAAMWFSWIVVRAMIRRFEKQLLHKHHREGEPASEREKRVDTLSRLVQQGVFLGMAAVVGLGILKELGISIGPILASAGVIGLAIGFGAQNLVRDVISGFFMLLENQVRVGDMVIVNNVSGTVEEVNFRTLVVRDISGIVHFFPNGTITLLSNETRRWSGHLMFVEVAYKEDPDHVMQVMRKVSEEMQADEKFGKYILEPITIYGLDEFRASGIAIKARLKTRPNKQYELGREYKRRLKLAFAKEGIEFPFPTRSLEFSKASQKALSELFDRRKNEIDSAASRES